MSQAISLGQYWPLWLLVGVPLIGLAAWRHRTALGRARMAGAAALRAGALALLALALAQPALHRGTRDVSVVYALDLSRSIAPEFLTQALAWIREANQKGAPAQARYVAFAASPRLLGSIDDFDTLKVSDGQSSERDAIDQSATNLERALGYAMFGFAPNHAPRLVLLSDGNQTDGDAWSMLPRLREQGVRVFGVPAAVALTRDAWIEAIELPHGVRQDEFATVKLRAFSRQATPARIELLIGEHSAGMQSVNLNPGVNEFAFEAQFKQAGRNRVQAKISADGDQIAQNDLLAEDVWIGPKPKVLYVEGAPASARYLRDALVKQGIDVKLAGAEGFAANKADYDGFDAVVLSDVRADTIGAASAKRLDQFVRDGGALIFTAGENTYGKDGFRRSRIENLLPVAFEAQRKRKDLDLVLLIDRSFSMRGKKLEFAKSAALATLDLLEPQHRLAVVAFDARPHEVVPLSEVGNKRRAEDQISSMAAGGQTNIFNALVHARALLKDSTAKTKHVILLSDGESMPAGRLDPSGDVAKGKSGPGTPYDRFVAEEVEDDGRGMSGFQEIATRLAAENVTVSTVIMGEKPNLPLMTGLAKWGKGKHHIARSEAEIPSLFVSEARRLMGESIIEEPFTPVVKQATEALAGVEFAKAPMLKGFVVARAKPFSEVLLEAKDNKPLLVQTHHGLGKSITFLSDVKNRWSADWLGWSGYGKLWAQTIRASIRRDAGEELALRVGRDGRHAQITLNAFAADGQFRNQLAPKLRVTRPDGAGEELVLTHAGPGRYQGRIELQPSSVAPYGFELIDTPGIEPAELARVASVSLFYPHSDEYQALPANETLLKTLSEQTGGKFMPKIDDVFADYGERGKASKALWSYCAAGALLLFLLDILLRRAPRLPSWSRKSASAART